MRRMIRTVIAVAAASLLGACAYIKPVKPTAEAPKKRMADARRHMTDSRLAKKGSPKSRGISVYQIRRIEQTGEANLGAALREITPVIQSRPQ